MIGQLQRELEAMKSEAEALKAQLMQASRTAKKIPRP